MRCACPRSCGQRGFAQDPSRRWPGDARSLPRALAKKTPWQQVWGGDLACWVSEGRSGTAFVRRKGAAGEEVKEQFSAPSLTPRFELASSVPGVSNSFMRSSCSRKLTYSNPVCFYVITFLVL